MHLVGNSEQALVYFKGGDAIRDTVRVAVIRRHTTNQFGQKHVVFFIYTIKYGPLRIIKLNKATQQFTIVLKIGPDRPVQPGTGLQSGPVMIENRKWFKNR